MSEHKLSDIVRDFNKHTSKSYMSRNSWVWARIYVFRCPKLFRTWRCYWNNCVINQEIDMTA